MEFPDQDDLLNFKLIISPDEVNKIIENSMYIYFEMQLNYFSRDFTEEENLRLVLKLVLGIPTNLLK